MATSTEITPTEATEAEVSTPDVDETPEVEAKPEPKAKPDHRMTTEAAKWVAENARPRESSCLCGCGGLTKTRFVPGHDALLKRSLAATAESKGAAAKHAKAALETFGW
jgi:hypothetical protein